MDSHEGLPLQMFRCVQDLNELLTQQTRLQKRYQLLLKTLGPENAQTRSFDFEPSCDVLYSVKNDLSETTRYDAKRFGNQFCFYKDGHD